MACTNSSWTTNAVRCAKVQCRLIQTEQVFYRQDNMLYFLTMHSKDASIAELRSYNLDLRSFGSPAR